LVGAGLDALEVGEAVDCSDGVSRAKRRRVRTRRRVGKLDKVACCRAINIGSYLEEEKVTNIFEAPYQGLFPTFTSFAVTQRSALPVVSDISHSRCQLFDCDTQLITVSLRGVHKRHHCAMALKCDGSEVVNKAGMDFGDQLTGRLDEGMSDSMFELV